LKTVIKTDYYRPALYVAAHPTQMRDYKTLPLNVSGQSESLFGESTRNKNITFHTSKSENCGSSLNKNEVDHPVDV
jgi:hypothetical protein